MFELTSPPAVAKRLRGPRRRGPLPRFKPDAAAQLDAAHGCPEVQVPQGHLAREVRGWVAKLDTSEVEAGYSSIGRQGYHPRAVLAVWVYASLTGLHFATQVARALKTDAAFRLLSGGHAFSEGVLKRFRQHEGELLQSALEQTVRLAGQAGLLDEADIAVDSVRLRAHASTKQVRTLKRSKERLAELAAVDSAALPQPAQAAHAQKVRKHQEAVRMCEEKGASSVVLSSPSAALMKFPSGAGLPGHRATVAAAGKSSRLVIGVLLDAAAVDYGHLEGAVREAHRVLLQAGLPKDTPLQVAADAGYWSGADLTFAMQERAWVDVLLAEPPTLGEPTGVGGMYSRADFRLDADKRTVSCPAGRPMRGPSYDRAHGYDRFVGQGCATCPLKPKCTKARERNLTVDWDFEKARGAMQERMARSGARERYNRRIATVEPVFASLEATMGFRRVSSRLPQTVKAEVLLKLLAHNISRLISREKLVLFLFRLA